MAHEGIIGHTLKNYITSCNNLKQCTLCISTSMGVNGHERRIWETLKNYVTSHNNLQ